MNEQVQLVIEILAVVAAAIGVVVAIIKVIEAYNRWKASKSGGSDMKPNQTTHQTANSSAGTGSITGDNNTQTISVNIGHQVEIAPQPQDVQEDQENDDIILKKEYTSLFAENGKLQHERIQITKCASGQVEGDVYLDEQYIYKLTGTFRNRILTGEFSAVGKFVDERGTINLKLIGHDILSGFCSFSKISMEAEDQIRVSPYVWVAGESLDLIKGTYEFCTQCHSENKMCCCASDDIDMPILLQNEALQIQSMRPRDRRLRVFSNNIGHTPIRQMKSKPLPAGGVASCACHFYDVNEHKCTIYDIRPVDCRLFPFDIRLDKDTDEYWIGYYDELCERSLPDGQTMRKYAHVLRPFIFLLYPFANIITADVVCTKLKDAHFQKLYRLNQFIF